MRLIDQINESAIFSQSGYSADTATHDSLGNVIADTYISAVSASANRFLFLHLPQICLSP